MAQPLVSILIPNYNSADLIAQCLDSCLNQDYPNIEIIIVDNNSSDQSLSIASKYAQEHSDVIRLLNCPQQGANFARPQAFQNCNGEYIQWLDSDDLIAQDKIKLQVEGLEANRDYDIANCNGVLRRIEDQALASTLNINTFQSDNSLLQLLEHFWIPQNCYLLRRKTAEKLHDIQAWSPDTNCLQDAEYFLCAAALDSSVLYVANTSAAYNHWGENQTSRASQTRRAAMREKIYKRVQSIYQENHSGEPDPQVMFLLQTNALQWRLNTELAEQFCSAEPASQEEKQLASLVGILLSSEKSAPTTSGADYEVFAERILFGKHFGEWALAHEEEISPELIGKFVNSIEEIPTRPYVDEFGIWSQLLGALSQFSRMNLLQQVS